MSGFIASPPSPASPAGAKITGGTFWPEIDVNDFRDAMRVGGGTVTETRIKPALRDAMISVGMDLKAWRLANIAAGFLTLAAVPCDDDEIDGETAYVALWRRAVYATATADLVETHRDLTATAEGARRAEEFMPAAGDHRRNAIRAIRAILGSPASPGISVDLI
jgi:hypothetical protein